jgi:thioredoxin 1
MIDVTGDIEKALSTEGAVVYFTASWCQPCKQLKPIYAKAGMQDNNHQYFVIDVDTIDSKYTEEYNIRSVPTLFKMNNGIVEKTITARTADDIIAQVNS